MTGVLGGDHVRTERHAEGARRPRQRWEGHLQAKESQGMPTATGIWEILEQILPQSLKKEPNGPAA